MALNLPFVETQKSQGTQLKAKWCDLSFVLKEVPVEALLDLSWQFGRIDRIGIRVLGLEGGAAIAYVGRPGWAFTVVRGDAGHEQVIGTIAMDETAHGGSITSKETRDALEWKHSDLKKFTGRM